jgi:chemotaxis family two-component system sensor kinase Cph1
MATHSVLGDPDLSADVVETLPEGVTVVGADDRSVMVANARAHAMFGYGPGELLGVPLAGLTAGGDAGLDELARGLEREGAWRGPVRHVRKDGNAFGCRDHVRAFVHHRHGTLWVAVHSDVSEERWTGDALRISEERFRVTMQHAPMGLALLDLDGRWLDANPALCALLGRSREELLGLTLAEVTHPDDVDAGRACWDDLLAGSVDSCQLELRLLGRLDSPWQAALSFSPVRESGGEPLHVVLRAHDVTEQRRNEEQLVEVNRALLESNADLSQFASVAAHDLKSPAQAVLGFAELLALQPGVAGDEEATEYVGAIVKSAQRMGALVDDLLDYSRVGTTRRERRPVDAAELWSDTVRAHSRDIAATGATVRAGALPTVLGDATLLALVFSNLLTNALKFRGPGVVPAIEVWAEAEDAMWRFVVADNGIGVDPRFRERAFGMFERLPTRSAYDGTGIGLAICKRVVERHGGGIRLDANPGGGTRVVFTLPAARAGRSEAPCDS